jgi:gas vesicle protein
MSRDSDGHAGVIMMAFVMGAIAGAATALLVAPASGSETRLALNERAREGRDKAGSAARQGAEFIKKQREQIATAIDRGREAYQEARESESPSIQENG